MKHLEEIYFEERVAREIAYLDRGLEPRHRRGRTANDVAFTVAYVTFIACYLAVIGWVAAQIVKALR